MRVLNTSVVLLLVFVGMALILTEFLVKARGLAGLIGLLALAAYFYMTAAGVTFWMIGLFLIGLTLMIVDGKLMQDGTLATVGLVLMLCGLVFPMNDIWLGTGVAFALILGILMSFLSLRLLPKRDMWEKLTLRDRFTSETGYSSMNQTHAALVGRSGRALTDMRPSGTIDIDGKRYSAVSDGTWVAKGSLVEVDSVSGTRILVRKIEGANQKPKRK